MEDLFCIVSGGNSGIGKEISRGLLEKGAKVVLACRNMDSCELVRSELLASTGRSQSSCSCAQVDLEDLQSIRDFAVRQKKDLKSARRKLDVLINNAGVMSLPDGPDGEDRTLLANHFGPFLLTNLMIPTMSTGSRIVNVSSRAHYQGSLHFDDSENLCNHPRWWFAKYSRSKLANVSFTLELQRRLQPKGITAYATSPGPVNTSLFRNFPWYTQWVLRPLTSALFRTPKQGAQSTLYAALSPELSGKNVLFIHDDCPMEASESARDRSTAQRLWRASEKRVELGKYPEDEGCLLSEPS
ncbi:hypothetical protein CEUSTIGMA_g7540.t1 [Chlamydomonas eustigma]|uniref:Short-chain dehydrogenase n=1 Tax=Chlamydomonas eustigma TaxID=1157962 RepID=A0A250XB51_9CHLO|nr:hypothetical protein CEUSTIGMA_g7540.t1 [Chlamydomonas eustigma]|eukprot:GAX80102.1 hypothetical protein CEUSTIGMA_g7540.t1 [Chlamydomonas eustigma]